MSDRKPILSREEVANGTFTDVPWNSERAIGALNLQVFYEAKISFGELMTKAQAEALAQEAVEFYKKQQAIEHYWDE